MNENSSGPLAFFRQTVLGRGLAVLGKTMLVTLGVCVMVLPCLGIFVGGLVKALSGTGGHAAIYPAIVMNEKQQFGDFASRDPYILCLDIQEQIGTRDLNTDSVDEIFRLVRSNWLGNRKLSAILLRVNSPGGATVDSLAIYHLLKAFKEEMKVPVYAHVDGLCCSGAYMISCAADRIYATPPSIVGSIGTRIGLPNFSGAMEKVGVEFRILSEGRGKTGGDPYIKWDETASKPLQDILAVHYRDFVSIVSQARGIEEGTIRADFGANVFSVPASLDKRLIDSQSLSLAETVKALAAKANLQEYQLIEARITPSFGGMLSLMDKSAGSLYDLASLCGKALDCQPTIKPLSLYEATLSP